MNRSQTQSSHLPISSDTIRRMVEHLILNSSFTSDLGLFHGKMGIVIFFAHYARWTGNALYEDFADELLAEIYEDIHTDTPINLESGLCGIGWGIEYLVQNGFMEGDTDEILEDIDRRIMERDPRRMTDLSFRTGLGGILFYATARLTASRESDGQPFDSLYLNDLKEAAQRATFTEQDEIPSCLFENFLSALHGDPLPAPSLPVLLFTNLPQSDTYITLPVGLEKGIAGVLLNMCISEYLIDNKEYSKPGKSKSKYLYIFNEESRASAYGIGTYVKQVVEALYGSEWMVYIVMLKSTRTSVLLEEKENEIYYLHVGRSKEFNVSMSSKNRNRYYHRSLMLLHSYIHRDNVKNIFHLQQMHMSDLAIRLKVLYPRSTVIGTVHYMDWSFSLLGDKVKLKSLLNKPEEDESRFYVERIAEEKSFLDNCDIIIAIAHHSLISLQEIYQIPKKKIKLILNGLKDQYIPYNDIERESIRNKYGFKSSDTILIFAGRIDPVKGPDILARCFALLASEHSELRFIVAGSGDFSLIQKEINPFWSKVTLVGLVDKNTLYELYSISDIGILPSLHEEFGYVALEMMMVGLPLVVSRTTGLDEMVIDGETGLKVSFSEEDKRITGLQTAVKKLLLSPLLRRTFGRNGRKRFMSLYEIKAFRDKIKSVYQ